MISILAFVLILSPLTDLQKTFKPHQGFEADFVQNIEQEIFSKDESVALGTIKFKKPSLLRWEYLKPKKKIIELKNNTLIIEEDGRAEVASGSNRVNLEEAFSFLWGDTNRSQFDVQVISENQFQLTPKMPDHVTFKSILVTTGRQKNKIFVETAEVNGKLGDKSILRFSNWKLQ